jgi:hypothetical protein
MPDYPYRLAFGVAVILKRGLDRGESGNPTNNTASRITSSEEWRYRKRAGGRERGMGVSLLITPAAPAGALSLKTRPTLPSASGHRCGWAGLPS